MTHAEIKLKTPNSRKMPLVIGAVAAILFSAAAMSFMPVQGWLQGSSERPDMVVTQEPLREASVEQPAASAPADRVRSRTKCDECGIIESMQRVTRSGISTATYEITIRLSDGSRQIVSDTNPARWRPGERNTLIGYRAPPGR